MNLIAVLKYLYPHADPLTDFVVADDSNGQPPYIAQWFLSAPKPTAAQLLAAEKPAALYIAKTSKLDELTTACQAAITGGYESDALGTTHIYPSGPTDQANMQASIIASLLPGLPAGWTTPFTCVEPANAAQPEWPLKDHTAAQIQQAGRDGKAWITAQRLQLRTLAAQITAATSVDAVNAITWSNAKP